MFLLQVMFDIKLYIVVVFLFGIGVTAFQSFTVKEHVLPRHIYFTLYAKDWLNCIMACNADQRCISYNYEYSATNNGLCELNECGVDSNKQVNEVLIYTRGSVFQQLRPTKERKECKPKVCLVGYLGDGVTCKDIDECESGDHNCSQNANCTNRKGSYNCTCSRGYHGDGVNCTDIDECTNGIHNCSHSANCTNTDGSYNCTCMADYYGDGVGCKVCAIFDFENGSLTAEWNQTGTAFNNQPTYGDNPTARGRRQSSNHIGDWWIGTFENRPSPSHPAGANQSDRLTGTLTSPPFLIKTVKLTFLIGGGCDTNKERAELLIKAKVVANATGKCNETMEIGYWNVSSYKGRIAQLRIVDDGTRGWGHINFDHFSYC